MSYIVFFLFFFYGIPTFIGYSMSNLFLLNKSDTMKPTLRWGGGLGDLHIFWGINPRTNVIALLEFG